MSAKRIFDRHRKLPRRIQSAQGYRRRKESLEEKSQKKGQQLFDLDNDGKRPFRNWSQLLHLSSQLGMGFTESGRLLLGGTLLVAKSLQCFLLVLDILRNGAMDV